MRRLTEPEIATLERRRSALIGPVLFGPLQKPLVRDLVAIGVDFDEAWEEVQTWSQEEHNRAHADYVIELGIIDKLLAAQ